MSDQKNVWTKERVLSEIERFKAESEGLPPPIVAAISNFFGLLLQYFDTKGVASASTDELNAFLKQNGSEILLRAE